MKAKEIVLETSPWVSVENFLKWAESLGVTVSEGKRHKRINGEVHLILTHKGGATHELHASMWWDYKWRWQEAIDWVEAQEVTK